MRLDHAMDSAILLCKELLRQLIGPVIGPNVVEYGIVRIAPLIPLKFLVRDVSSVVIVVFLAVPVPLFIIVVLVARRSGC